VTDQALQAMSGEVGRTKQSWTRRTVEGSVGGFAGSGAWA